MEEEVNARKTGELQEAEELTIELDAFSPGSNALLATLYISLFPNLILGFIPPDLELKSLNVMIGVSSFSSRPFSPFLVFRRSPPSLDLLPRQFATGGLLGDTFLNLIPHSFLGEPHPSGDVHIVVVVSSARSFSAFSRTRDEAFLTLSQEPRRNVLIGCALFGGFALFFLIDKVRFCSSPGRVCQLR